MRTHPLCWTMLWLSAAATGCQVDPRPPRDACDPALGAAACRTGYRCDPAQRRCIAEFLDLTVAVTGSGTGSVASSPGGIICDAVCTAPFASGSSVTLAATADAGSTFEGWDEPSCPGVTPCGVTMDTARTIGARFSGGAVRWSRAAGGFGSDAGYGVAVDSAGNVIVAGSFEGQVDFGGGTFTAAVADIFVAKFSGADGSHLWSIQHGGADVDFAQAVAVDAAGDVFVTGYFGGTIDFGGGPLVSVGLYDIFVAKFSGADGSHVWSRAFGNTRTDFGHGIAVDTSGDVVVIGYFNGMVDFGCGAHPGNFPSYDVFIAKFAGTDGACRWSNGFGASGEDYGQAVAVDGMGDVFAIGYFQLTVDFGGGSLTSRGNSDVFVAKYSGLGGAWVWSAEYGGTGNDFGSSIATDGSNNVLIAGSFEGTANFGGSSLTIRGMSDAFVAKYVGTDGTPLWARGIGGTGADFAAGVAATTTGDAVLTGSFQDIVDFAVPGAGGATSAGIGDLFVLGLTGNNGASRWVRPIGGSGRDVGYAVAAAAGGDSVATGAFEDMADFGDAIRVSAGAGDVFFLRLAP